MLHEVWMCPCFGAQQHLTPQQSAHNQIQALYNETDAAKGKRLIAMMTCLHKLGMVETIKCHKSGKVPLKEDAKLWVGVTSCEKSGYHKPPSCSICKHVGHN
jgi:hypothetical protein